MHADLYIIDVSSIFNNQLSKKEIVSCLNNLNADIYYIRKLHGSENTILVNNTVYDIPFYGRYTISDLINNKRLTEMAFSRDFYNSLSTNYKI
ncbi:hypothetical protein Barb6_02337 [Bacteroidales bacterium Barb6]|nr:hypothetical protein Barb6_02337 [Bacteroidales bacterium Barb6]